MYEGALPAGLTDDLIAFSFASVIVASGIVSLAMATARRSGARPMLAWLGTFAALYGIRIAVDTDAAALFVHGSTIRDFAQAYLTYLIPIPAFLLFHTCVGPKGDRLFRVAMTVQVVYSVSAIVIDTVTRTPEMAIGPNGPIVVAVACVMLPRVLSSKSVAPTELRPLRFGIAAFILFALHENLADMGLLHSPTGLEPIGMLCFLAGVGISIARHVEQTTRRLAEIEGELQVAQRIQSSLLPRSAPAVASLDVAAMQTPTRDVGGDFYDFVPLGDRSMGVLVADVAGHGVPAALIASMVKIALASLRGCANRPAELLAGMNAVLLGQIGRGFVTAAYAVIDTGAGTIRSATAGHPAPLLVVPDALPRAIESRGAILGRFADSAFEEVETPFPPGASLVLYTDGVTEARRGDGESFGEQRLASIAPPAGSDASGHMGTILDRLRSFRGDGGTGFEDDVTIVVVRHCAADAAAGDEPAP